MSVSLVKAYIGHEPVAPAAWLLENVSNRPAAYRYLGGELPGDLTSVHTGWSALQAEESEGGYVRNHYAGMPRFVEVPVTLWGDYCGSDYGRSNFRVLADELRAYGVVEVIGDFFSQWLVLPAYAPIPLHLLESLRTLADEYPLWDESDHSELTMEMTSEAWSDYARDDMLRDIGRTDHSALCAWIEGQDTDTLDALLQRVVWEFYSDGSGEYPYAETATSVIFPLWEDLTAHMVATLLPMVPADILARF